MINYLKKLFTFVIYSIICNILFVSLSYGQLIFRNNQEYSKYFKLYPFIILIGGIQTLILMKATRYGLKILNISALTIQLFLVFIGFLLIYLLNSLILKQTVTSITDLIGFGLMIIGLFIGEKYKKRKF